MVEKPMELGIDEYRRKIPIEERLYRHRCTLGTLGMAIMVRLSVRKSLSSWQKP